MEIKEHVAEIISAYLRKNQVSADQLTSTITAVYNALAALGKPAEPVVSLTPAVPVRRSVRPDQISCLECRWSGKTIRRHLGATHGLTPTSIGPGEVWHRITPWSHRITLHNGPSSPNRLG